jgi:hypothetical protein
VRSFSDLGGGFVQVCSSHLRYQIFTQGVSINIFDLIVIGRVFADSNIFLIFAIVLASLDISKEMDAEGNDVVPSIEFVGEVLR